MHVAIFLAHKKSQVYNEKNAISHRNKFHDQVTYVNYVYNELVYILKNNLPIKYL